MISIPSLVIIHSSEGKIDFIKIFAYFNYLKTIVIAVKSRAINTFYKNWDIDAVSNMAIKDVLLFKKIVQILQTEINLL